MTDIGRRHHRNEDALALTASAEPAARAVLVACDGVSTATDSHIASAAASQAVAERLAQPMPRDEAGEDDWLATVSRAFTEAAQAGSRAAAATAADGDPSPPSCTLAAAIVEQGMIVGGNVGDSRVYWLPDVGPQRAVQLGTDDSMANELIRRGMGRAEAEATPTAHAITRWLGRDAPEDLSPHLAHLRVEEPGWLLVCTDGLWNYCSDPADVWDLMQRAVAQRDGTPGSVVEALVDFANGQGGADNITAIVARVVPWDVAGQSVPAR
nr:protein phosphatase 2C domain-containing protein [Flexivirga aerilata]